jgi:hypothetical protein
VHGVEVEKEADLSPAQFQVRQDLRRMKGKQLFYSLEFDDDTVLDQKVDSVARFKRHSAVHNRQANLSIELETLIRHLGVEACMVRAFEEPWTQRRMNAHSGGDDSLGHVIVKHQVITSVSSVSSVVASVHKQASVPM